LLNSIPAVFETLGPKRIAVMTLTFRGHMRSSVTTRHVTIRFPILVVLWNGVSIS